MRQPLTAFGILLVVALGAPAHAGDPAQGEKLHQQHCVSCHGTEVYTRDNRMINSMGSLVTQVNRCNVNLGTGWFDDEVEAVAAYLSENYYKF